MQQQQIKWQQKIYELVSDVHQKIKNTFSFIKQTRQLSEDENQLLQQFNPHSIKYKILVSILAIDTYSTRISDILTDIQSLFQIAVISINCLQSLKNQIQICKQAQRLKVPFQNVFKAVLNIIQTIKQTVPQSPYNQTLDRVIANSSVDYSENIYKQLKDQNYNLKTKLTNNDEHIVNLQIKLTKILNQHQGCQGQGNLEGLLNNFELREEINRQKNEIQRMNEQFSVQIQKYNVVYDSLKRQLNEYRSYQNIDLIQQIECLETQIIRLREEKERDQLMIQELRKKSTYFSQYQYPQSSNNYFRYNLRHESRQFSNRFT